MRLAELLHNDLLPKSYAELIVFKVTDDSREVCFRFVFCAPPVTSGNGAIVPEGGSDQAIELSEFEEAKVLLQRHPRIQTLCAEPVARFHPGRAAVLVACNRV